jgi:hypothetical protein
VDLEVLRGGRSDRGEQRHEDERRRGDGRGGGARANLRAAAGRVLGHRVGSLGWSGVFNFLSACIYSNTMCNEKANP